MAVSKRTRFEVLRRDNHACRYCGSMAPEAKLTVDHVTPVALGGTDSPDNLVAACRDCNAGKSSTSPDAAMVADVSQRAVEFAAAISAYNKTLTAERRKRAAYVRKFRAAWDQWSYGSVGGDRKRLPLPADWEITLWQFYSTGLPVAEVEEAVTIACGNKMVEAERCFRYMCGVVWNKINAMQEGAKSILEAGDA